MFERLRVTARQPGTAMDPLWYKDAIILETHVKAFYDSNGDGVGDFPGLLQKLDYIQDLGVTAIWLLPFFPSPLRDDGYDISDYTDVHPGYGTLDDFRRFLDDAHERQLRVIIELVINHTSDQHPWFQAARQAAPGSRERDLYVWSDTDQRYADARIIFTDTEESNWTWDPVAKAYYWHRFFSHQPELNYDSPEVLERVLAAMRFWLDMGVDGLRLDAIPYLVERDHTSCENLPETHAVIRRVRREIDEHYTGRMLLAEANQWPTDVRPYFGDGDECHMAFHFPVMPRIFMALRMEDRSPITDIMARTPRIPDTCQWALFLRNHDELTLEMVSADERDYMYLAYSADPKMKLNVGIRRRLAPLMENDRRRIELLNSLLFSFPGTPILYYGDEIGMGDNIYLGDRHGVRTPMQWSPDRNGGFSRAVPGRLYSAPIMDPVYGYEAVNVEAQLSDESSLLHWMRNMISLRKLFKVFGRGSVDFLNPQNRKVLAYTRSLGDDLILCVANLSRFGQAAELDLSAFAGMRPVEMFGYSEFPEIGREPYRLTLNPYGFFWFELQQTAQPAEVRAVPAERPPVLAFRTWRDLYESGTGEDLELRILPSFLAAQPWFAGRDRALDSVRIHDWAELPDAAEPSSLVLLRVRYLDGGSEGYFVPLSLIASSELPEESIGRVAMASRPDGGTGCLADSAAAEAARRVLLEAIEHHGELATRRGSIRAGTTSAYAPAAVGPAEPVTTWVSVERSTTMLQFDERVVLKLYRRLDEGGNPELEILRHLTAVGFDGVPALAGALEYAGTGEELRTLALVQSAIDHEGDGWSWSLQELGRYYDACAGQAERERYAQGVGATAVSRTDPDNGIGLSLEAAAALGRRTAQLHAALANPVGDAGFAPEPIDEREVLRTLAALRSEAALGIELLEGRLQALTGDARESAERLRLQREQLARDLERIPLPAIGQKIRVHGDYHLGQVLRVRNDYVILNFEGAPDRDPVERRRKVSPLSDVAGMMRSFAYAAHAGLAQYLKRQPDRLRDPERYARDWERQVSETFLHAYAEVASTAALVPTDPEPMRQWLRALLLDGAFRDLRRDLNLRPARAGIPLRLILEGWRARTP